MTEFQLSGSAVPGIMPEYRRRKIPGDTTHDPSTGNGICSCEIYLNLNSPEEDLAVAIQAGVKRIQDEMLMD